MILRENANYEGKINGLKIFSIKTKLQPSHDIYPGLFLDIIDMLMPRTIVGKKYTKMFMRFNFLNKIIIHKERWMFRFIKFTRNKKRLCFLGIKRNKPRYSLSHTFFKIKIENLYTFPK